MNTCEYCKTTNRGNEYHSGTCENCGAQFPENKEFIEGIRVIHSQYVPQLMWTTSSVVNINTRMWLGEHDGS